MAHKIIAAGMLKGGMGTDEFSTKGKCTRTCDRGESGFSPLLRSVLVLQPTSNIARFVSSPLHYVGCHAPQLFSAIVHDLSGLLHR